MICRILQQIVCDYSLINVNVWLLFFDDGLRVCIVQPSSFLLSCRSLHFPRLLLFSSLRIQRMPPSPIFLLSLRNEAFPRPLPWAPHASVSSSCCQSFDPRELSYRLFLCNGDLLFLGTVKFILRTSVALFSFLYCFSGLANSPQSFAAGVQ